MVNHLRQECSAMRAAIFDDSITAEAGTGEVVEAVVEAVLIGRGLVVVAAVRVSLAESRTGLPRCIRDLIARPGLSRERIVLLVLVVS